MYGRLGMKNIENYSFIDHKKNLDVINKNVDIISYKEINNVILVDAEYNNKLISYLNIKRKKTKNNIVLAACITSKARIKLFNAQEQVRNNNGRLLYSDTDSIFAAFNRNVIGEKHGDIY
jgi:hypothetical protein